MQGVVVPYALKTLRLAEVLTVIAFALGGEAGRRLGQEIGLLTSPDTFLRLIARAVSRKSFDHQSTAGQCRLLASPFILLGLK